MLRTTTSVKRRLILTLCRVLLDWECKVSGEEQGMIKSCQRTPEEDPQAFTS